MSRFQNSTGVKVFQIDQEPSGIPSQARMTAMLGVRTGVNGTDVETLPFARYDATAGSETELQAAVVGQRSNVDLPLTIEASNYFTNMLRRAAAGDTKKRVVTDLESYLDSGTDQLWENSWVGFPADSLGPFAWRVWQRDLLADKENPSLGNRSDADRFVCVHRNRQELRVPVSYLLKLALAEAMDSGRDLPGPVRETGLALLDHFLNDNTSPETFSFSITALRPEEGMGRAVAAEMAVRYLFTQLLVQFANERFGLTSGGQKAMLFYSPHPPIRQKRLNDCISDAFYRELFMSPCLSGWSRGEEKHQYMHLCHRVLSRSQLNAVGKLREAGVVTSNLVTLPNTSNVSLANNGTHVSMGSRRIGAAMADPSSGFHAACEKYLGDLAVKIVEHFLPLFVGTYSAAPYRMDFLDFHPEKALGFLPHELDYTHLRMLWRRWQKKAGIRVLGRPVTPFGPLWLDRFLRGLFSLKGDFIPDYRLIDYLVVILSTERSPALDGRLHNGERLKRDLQDLGVFDTKMSLYLLEKLREFNVMGFSGFEARHYSLFESFEEDAARAINLQNLLYCLAFKYIAGGMVTHDRIPDSPVIESERRQILFGAAIGIPTFFVRQDSANRFLMAILARTERTRPSRRYPGYIRVHNLEYRRALVNVLREEAADLIEMLGFEETILDLERRLEDPERLGAAGKITRAVLKGKQAPHPLAMPAGDFNRAAEAYYRQDLRGRHMTEAFRFLEEKVAALGAADRPLRPGSGEALRAVLGNGDPLEYLDLARRSVLEEKAPEPVLLKLLFLMMVVIHEDKLHDQPLVDPFDPESVPVASVY
ncbi:MAG TPA: hypothetical protein PLO63_12310 [Syntrophales bacterium]|nr:hypothetical protein [Syntrophales bacterium]